MTAASPKPIPFDEALRTFNTPVLRHWLEAEPMWPDSLTGLPPWSWVVDNAIARLGEVGSLKGTRKGAASLDTVLTGLRDQFALLRQTGQDATRVEWSHRHPDQSHGGCLHRLLIMGSVRPQSHMAALAQCVLEHVPEEAHHISDHAGQTAHDLLMHMGKGGAEHNLPAFHQAWAAHEARVRLEQAQDGPAPIVRHRRRSRS
jgi:hypothetical protein